MFSRSMLSETCLEHDTCALTYTCTDKQTQMNNLFTYQHISELTLVTTSAPKTNNMSHQAAATHMYLTSFLWSVLLWFILRTTMSVCSLLIYCISIRVKGSIKWAGQVGVSYFGFVTNSTHYLTCLASDLVIKECLPSGSLYTHTHTHTHTHTVTKQSSPSSFILLLHPLFPLSSSPSSASLSLSSLLPSQNTIYKR